MGRAVLDNPGEPWQSGAEFQKSFRVFQTTGGLTRKILFLVSKSHQKVTHYLVTDRTLLTAPSHLKTSDVFCSFAA
jgi:hypothetical protein